MIYPITSEAERARALDYIVDRLGGTLLVARLVSCPTLERSGALYTVCSPGKPGQQDYRYGWGGQSSVPTEWLASEILSHLQSHDENLCLVEDVCAMPLDPRLAVGAPGPALFYDDHVLWPITQRMASIAVITRALEWGNVGRPTAIAFCSGTQPADSVTKPLELHQSVLEEYISSTVALATDVFDEEGLLIWSRAPSREGGCPATGKIPVA
jgi:hypothetical protein